MDSTLTTEELETAWYAATLASYYIDFIGNDSVDDNVQKRIATMKSELDAWHDKYRKEVN